MNTYYNTTHEKGETLRSAMKKAKTQQERIYKIFQVYGQLCPATCHRFYESIYFEAPITSIRRAITNLTKAGKLQKTGKKVTGRYSRNNYVWKLA